MKSEVTKEQIHSFLNGHNPMERIIKIEGEYSDEKMSVIYRNESGLKCVSHEPFYPFCWAKQSAGRGLFGGNRSLLKAKLQQYHISCKGLRVENSDGKIPERMERGYRILFRANAPMSYQKFMQFFKEGGRPLYPNQNDENYGLREYIVVNPIEQFMIQTGKRQFKTYDDYDELLRMEFDLETEGLDPQKDAISQIGIRTNRGFEKIIPILGKGEEKLKNEVKGLEEFFRTVREIDPDVLTGHNIENFDMWFIDERLKLRDSSLEKFT
jgi:DNA polymerase elongation subunit (family B)